MIIKPIAYDVALYVLAEYYIDYRPANIRAYSFSQQTLKAVNVKDESRFVAVFTSIDMNNRVFKG